MQLQYTAADRVRSEVALEGRRRFPYHAAVRKKDTADVLASSAAVVADAAAVFGGFLLATWIRFDSGLIPLALRIDWWFIHAEVPSEQPPPDLYFMYGWGAALAALLFLFLFRSLALYVRPQVGNFGNKVPRLVRATALGILLATALAFAIRTDPPFSRITMALSFAIVCALLILERWLLFRAEIRYARRRKGRNRVLILGTDEVAARLRRALERDPRLASEVVGFVRVDGADPDAAISPERVLGAVDDIPALLDGQRVDQLILAASSLPPQRVIEIILLCEKHLIQFNLVPDLFRVLTAGVDMQMVDDIPLLGVGRWPLDFFWNRCLKRAEDIAGAVVGLVLTAPLIAAAAAAIRRSSAGPVFYRQERCGENGRRYTLYKLRTMQEGAEDATGPVWATENDPRRTAVGAFLRRHNLDELPQLWNVLRGDMSLVGPRPERPHFVEKFKEDISGYMWRHVSKPGMTGWAQVNGLRGNTSIEERIKYDLYYLENWSLSFDFKIIVKTFVAHRNAY